MISRGIQPSLNYTKISAEINGDRKKDKIGEDRREREERKRGEEGKRGEERRGGKERRKR